MNADSRSRHGVLRGLATHGQPRRLGRPVRRPATDAAREAVPDTAQAPHAGAAAPAAEPAGWREGFEAGRAEGLQQGLADAQARVDAAARAAREEFEQAAGQRLREFQAEADARVGRLDRLVAGLEAALVQRVAELEADAVALAFAAVCKVAGSQPGDAEAVARLVRHGFEQLRGATLLAVRLNEADLRALQAHPQGRQLAAHAPQVRWVADAAVAAGGCFFDTAAGTLDARLDVQLEALRTLWSACAKPAQAAAE